VNRSSSRGKYVSFSRQRFASVTRGLCLWCAVLLLPFVSEAQERERKQARAVRVADGVVRLDGRLDEAAWRSVPAISDFIQTEPQEGAAATARTDVRFVFDDEAIYVGARMESAGPIQAPLGRRDQGDQAEFIQVSLDSYLDRRTAASFGVTATGVRLDQYYASDNQFSDDETFNPVWQARTSIDARGWTAELWIPFSQLRFNDRTPQIWGLNVRRWIPSMNEDVYWSPLLRTDDRWASLFGDLHGLDGIRPRQRIEIIPYTAADAQIGSERAPGDPFHDPAKFAGRVGADAKIGIGSNLTLEATVNPDFGQVEADPAEVNLSVFETFFDERRPFFVEGASLLRGNVNNYFYSRRIGAPPAGRADADFAEYPGTTTILAAGKLTGRLESGSSIGVLAAVTDEETARTVRDGLFGRVRVAPRTTYGVARVEQEFGTGSTTGLMATMVHREMDGTDPLADLLTRDAVSLSSDSVLRFGDYEWQAYFGVTHVGGEPGAIERLQRASARYYQRPDVSYVRFDPTRRSLNGAKGGMSVERQNARHWFWRADSAFETPGFETNDIGRLTSGDGIRVGGEVEYQETTPNQLLREYSFRVSPELEWNYGGARQVSAISTGTEVTWPNFWQTELTLSYDFRRQDMRLTRGGPSMERPRGWSANLRVESSDAQQTSGDVDGRYSADEDGGWTFNLDGGFTVRPRPQWLFSIRPEYRREIDTQQYIATLDGGTEATYGRRYIFGRIDRSTYSAQVRLNYTFKPDLNLDFYAEPFVASGRYDRLGALAAARGRQLLAIDPLTPGAGARDFNVRSFRSNLVLRWEWRAGSTLYVVWQQNRREDVDGDRDASAGDLFRSLAAPGDDVLAIKASFWFSLG
jgi:hypothetical protein